MQEKFIHEDLSIKLSVLKKLPRESRVLAFVWCEDMGGIERKAMIVSWTLRGMRGDILETRYAYYSLAEGEYLGEKITEGRINVFPYKGVNFPSF